MEIFGPTIQGEGPEAGLPCAFVRFGGCDYRCSWCDTLSAVEPASVKENAEWLTAEQVIEALDVLSGSPRVILSGGNPALLNLGGLVEKLQATGRGVSVETQGSRWKPWLATVDTLVVSPKPPSSGMASTEHATETSNFLDQLYVTEVVDQARCALKVVVFDEGDYLWASALHARHPRIPFYVSAGTPQPTWDHDEPQTPQQRDDAEAGSVTMLRCNYQWLCERVSRDPSMADVRALPQLHVIAWGLLSGV